MHLASVLPIPISQVQLRFGFLAKMTGSGVWAGDGCVKFSQSLLTVPHSAIKQMKIRFRISLSQASSVREQRMPSLYQNWRCRKNTGTLPYNKRRKEIVLFFILTHLLSIFMSVPSACVSVCMRSP